MRILAPNPLNATNLGMNDTATAMVSRRPPMTPSPHRVFLLAPPNSAPSTALDNFYIAPLHHRAATHFCGNNDFTQVVFS